MICRSSTRNPVQIRAVQFYSSLVDTNGCGHVWRDRGRVRPATVIGLRPAAAQLRPENSAGCGFGQMSRIKCHALLPSPVYCYDNTNGRRVIYNVCIESILRWLFISTSLVRHHSCCRHVALVPGTTGTIVL
jgi:hypothetical protein